MDGFNSYVQLNSLGYRHFSVFTPKKYRNGQTGKLLSVDTNFVEGSWSGAKAHFKWILGTSIANFESHNSEILWRNFQKGSPGEIMTSISECWVTSMLGWGPRDWLRQNPYSEHFGLSMASIEFSYILSTIPVTHLLISIEPSKWSH